MNISKDKSIIFFDGVCVLCNWSVQFILKRDTKNHFLFSTLQSDVAKEFLLQNKDKIIHKDSIVLFKDGEIDTASTAVLKICSTLGNLCVLTKIFWLLPRKWRDGMYVFIAKKRYRWFGKKDSCMIPEPQIKHKFL